MAVGSLGGLLLLLVASFVRSALGGGGVVLWGEFRRVQGCVGRIAGLWLGSWRRDGFFGRCGGGEGIVGWLLATLLWACACATAVRAALSCCCWFDAPPWS